MIKKGDRVTIDGKASIVQGWYGAGKHRVYQLDDGRTVFDIHLLVECGDAKVEKADEQPRIPSLDELGGSRRDALDELTQIDEDIFFEEDAEEEDEA